MPPPLTDSFRVKWTKVNKWVHLIDCWDHYHANKHVEVSPQRIQRPYSDFLSFGWANSTSPLSESCFYFPPSSFTIIFWIILLIKTSTSCHPKPPPTHPASSFGSHSSLRSKNKQENSERTHTVCFYCFILSPLLLCSLILYLFICLLSCWSSVES